MKVQSIPFSENIITAALDCICNRCIMVFPTRASAAIAQKQFQPQWQLEEITWTTMEEFKSSLLITDQPRVEDDKRLLALYQVLTEEEKEYFHLSTYGDLVDWGNHFFQFFEELGEAGHSPDYLSSIADQGILYLRSATATKSLSKLWASRIGSSKLGIRAGIWLLQDIGLCS